MNKLQEGRAALRSAEEDLGACLARRSTASRLAALQQHYQTASPAARDAFALAALARLAIIANTDEAARLGG